MKIGSLDILKAYLGIRELSNINAYLGEVPIVKPTVELGYLTFKSTGNSTIALTNVGGNTPNIEYSLDNGITWTTWDYSAISLTNNKKVLMRGNNTSGFSTANNKYSQFVMTGSIAASGNIMSLIDGQEDGTKIIPAYACFYNLFYLCSSLTTAPELPATTLTNNCYEYLFRDCTSLTTAPELPANTVQYGSYRAMFMGCTGITSLSIIPATNLADRCYNLMFYGCSSLTTAPELPATTLTDRCYNGMFYNCSNLTTAPVLNATTVSTYSYDSMFRGCSKLNYIKCLATSISAFNCLSNWVSGVAATGTFVKKSTMSSWSTGINGIPSGWTVQSA